MVKCIVINTHSFQNQMIAIRANEGGHVVSVWRHDLWVYEHLWTTIYRAANAFCPVAVLPLYAPLKDTNQWYIDVLKCFICAWVKVLYNIQM